MNIYKATTKDKVKIASLIAQFRVELKNLKGIESKPNIKNGENEFDEYMNNDFPIYIAQENDGKLVGYLVCRIDNNVI